MLQSISVNLENIIQDEDNDNITYKIHVQKVNNSNEKPLETAVEISNTKNSRYWAKFDSDKLLISGKPD